MYQNSRSRRCAYQGYHVVRNCKRVCHSARYELYLSVFIEADHHIVSLERMCHDEAEGQCEGHGHNWPPEESLELPSEHFKEVIWCWWSKLEYYLAKRKRNRKKQAFGIIRLHKNFLIFQAGAYEHALARACGEHKYASVLIMQVSEVNKLFCSCSSCSFLTCCLYASTARAIRVQSRGIWKRY